MTRLTLIAACAALAACGSGETLYSYGAAGKAWQLESLDGADHRGMVSLRFPAPGRVAGQSPCGRFRARQTAPYPWLEIQALTVSGPACPGQTAEAALLAALQEMSLAEVAGDVMILSNDAGREMLFRAGG
ncbi:META domain-containing protein [Cribrihabitans pelagius]|uniref:META domain-containing protein n=1 Tax=Cribrihabitans pelagius TaxID=1765746 RepID=UPI003B5C7587